MPIRVTGPGSSTPAEVGAYGYVTFVTTGGEGTWDNPKTGVYNVEVANFNAATLAIELPIGYPHVWRIRKLTLIYIGSAPGAILYPVVNLYYGGVSTIFGLGALQITTLATDVVSWEDMPWIVCGSGVMNGTNVLVNQKGSFTMNHANYAATDDYRLSIELEWVTL